MALWYLSRATGAATLVLLTLTLTLGVVNVQRAVTRRMPRFVVDGWHRGISLLTCVLLVIHVATTVIDGYVSIRIVDVIVPFIGAYRPLWLGLGALSLDLLLALIVTSLLRARIGVRTWRAIHWAAYACWPTALLHGLGTGSDVQPGWMTWLALGCCAVVLVAVGARIADRRTAPALRAAAAAGLLASVVGLGIWLPSGPMAEGWAAKAGTPVSLSEAENTTTTTTRQGP